MKLVLRKQIVGLIVAVLFGTGCVNLKSLPSYARSGDIVNIGMAGIKFNTDGMVTLRPGRCGRHHYRCKFHGA